MEAQPMILKAERMAELVDYAKRHGQDTATALDDVLAEYFAWEKQDFEEAVSDIEAGFQDIKAGRVQDAGDMFEELRLKHGLPR